MPAGAVAEALEFNSSLSFHLAQLRGPAREAGAKRGRSLIYSPT